MMSRTERQTVDSDEFLTWVNYFERNRRRLLKISWESNPPLTSTERETIFESIRTFQLGESSDGRHLIHVAKLYAAKRRHRKLVEAIQLFIAEEQRHASDLAKFMTAQHISLAKRQWTDTVFRSLRKFWNLELCLTVLLTAELVAKVYYKALRNATNSPVLQQICRQLLRDEAAHVRFHTEILGWMRDHRSGWQNTIHNFLYSLFHRITLLVVWHEHRSVFKAGRYDFTLYWKSSRIHLQEAMKNIRRGTLLKMRLDAQRSGAFATKLAG
jgi:hypothetical protein